VAGCRQLLSEAAEGDPPATTHGFVLTRTASRNVGSRLRSPRALARKQITANFPQSLPIDFLDIIRRPMVVRVQAGMKAMRSDAVFNQTANDRCSR